MAGAGDAVDSGRDAVRAPLAPVRVLLIALAVLGSEGEAQERTTFTHADSLRGGNGPARAWWDVVFYDLRVRVDPSDSSVRGSNGIVYRALAPGAEMQIDLRVPLEIDSIVQRGSRLA